MQTQTIEVQIEAEVPVGRWCKDCVYFYDTPAGYGFKFCHLFLEETDIEKEGIVKCKACLLSCANGTERALKELAE